MSRTLVKSPPELWAECSDSASLARHLDQFGEIRITRLEPDTAVAWEGESISGTVRLEPSGWGTKVILTAAAEGQADVAVPEGTAAPPEPTGRVEPAIPPEPEARAEPEAVEPYQPPAAGSPRGGLLTRLRAWFAPPPAPEAVKLPPLASAERPPEPPLEPVAEEPPTPKPELPTDPTSTALRAALDSLGQAHHRPFSRA